MFLNIQEGAPNDKTHWISSYFSMFNQKRAVRSASCNCSWIRSNQSCCRFLFLQFCIQNCGAVTAGILGTLKPITALLSGTILLNEPFHLSTGIGCLLILSAIVIEGLDKSASAADSNELNY